MAFGSFTLVPGVNVERTPTLLRAAISQSNLVRFKDALVQKLGGWLRFYPFQVLGTPRDLHGWQDLNALTHLLVGTTRQLSVITGSNLNDITPQQLTTNPPPNISTIANSSIVTVIDPNITNVTTYDAVFFNVPVSQGGIVLDGLYQILSVTGTHSYTIDAGVQATTTETNPTSTNGTTASGNNTLHFVATPSWVVAGMVVSDVTATGVIPAGTTVLSTGVSTVVMSANATGAGVGNGDSIVFSSVPVFTTATGSSLVAVKLINHGITASGQDVFFEIPTTFNGVTIQGHYIETLTDANTFTIQASAAATGTGSMAMNSGNTQIVYYITLGPASLGVGYGLGLYGAGLYGFGTGTTSVQTGTNISAIDWTSDNWGEIALACPAGGGVYQYDPTGGFTNAQVVSTAPPFNAGLFVSTSLQILVVFGSSFHGALGYVRNPLLVQWSTLGDYTNFVVDSTSGSQAGNFIIPIGSEIFAGIAVPNQNLIWTDLDLWAMNYIGPPFVFGFNKIGAGAGTVSAHAVQQLRGSVFWMGRTNFYGYMGGGVSVLPCPVWDAVFQNLNTNFLRNVRAMPNTPFNEVGWLYPSLASTSGECDSYVKMNITEPTSPWDYGSISRSAWIDQTSLGMPIGASPGGFIYQHEVSPDADGAPIVAAFTTGFFYLAESEEFVIVDQILPDFKWAIFPGGPSATIQISFNVVNYPGDTPNVYGPYAVTQATEFISTRFRGRLMSVSVESADIGSFWRIGSIKYRYAPAGRR